MEHFRRASKVFLKDTPSGSSTTVDNNFTLKVVNFKDGVFLQGIDEIDTYRVFDELLETKNP